MTGVTEGFGTAAQRTTSFVFDDLGRIVQETEPQGGVGETRYDANGNVSAVDGDSSLAWTYDGANWVATAETVAGPLNVQPAVVLTHAYDAVGKRAGLTHGPDGIIVDGAWSYLHDGNGSLTQVTTPAGGTVDLSYDAAQRLERIAYPISAGIQVLYERESISVQARLRTL